MIAFPQPLPESPADDPLLRYVDSEEITLAHILDDESALSQVAYSERLKAILSDHLQEVATVLTDVPTADSEQLRRHMFAASRLLQQPAVLDLLTDRIHVIRPLLDILKTDGAVDPTTAGYCCQVLEALVTKQSEGVVALLNSEEGYVSAIRKHIGVRPVAELYLALVANQWGGGDESMKGRIAMFKSLLFALGNDRTAAELVNMGYVALEVLKRSAQIPGWTLLASTVLYRETLSHFESLISCSPCPAAEPVCNLVSQLLEYSDLDTLLDGLQMTITAVRSKSFEELPVIISKSYEELPDLCSPASCQSHAVAGLCRIAKAAVSALESQPQISPLPTAFGTSQEPLGAVRLAIIHFLNSALKLDNEPLLRAIGDTNYIEQVTRLFADYPWHSALHHSYEVLVKTVIDGPSTELKEALFTRAELVRVLSSLSSSTSPHRLGSLGHVTRIGNALVKIASVSARVRAFLNSSQWSEFAQGFLKTQNEKETASPMPVPAPIQIQTLELGDDLEAETEFHPTADPSSPQFPPSDISSDPEVEFEQGSDVFNDRQYWKLLRSAEEPQDLE